MEGLSIFPSGILVGEFLDGLMKQAKNTLDAEIQNANNPLIQKELDEFQQLVLAIDNTKSAYSDSLIQTVEEVSQRILNDLKKMDEITQDFQQRDHNLISKIQNYLGRLPFADLHPRVNSIETKNISIHFENVVQFYFCVDFANLKFLKPVLVFNGERFNFDAITIGEILFKVPVSKVFPFDSDKQSSFTPVIGTLEIPYDDSPNLSWYQFSFLYDPIKIFKFQILAWFFPSSPGSLTAIYTSELTDPEIKPYASQLIHLDSKLADKKEGCGYNHIQRFSVFPEEGYSFVLGTENIQRTESRGNHYEKFVEVALNKLTVEYAGDNCSDRHLGEVSFKVEASQIKTKKNEIIHQMQMEDLRWKKHKILTIHHEKMGRLFKLIFKAFDGSLSEFEIKEQNTKYLEIENYLNVTLHLLPILPKNFGLSSMRYF